MLSISTANVAYHTHEARQGYYESGASERGRWFGAGAAALGLDGELQIKSFEAPFSGFSPEGGKLVQNAGRTTGEKEATARMGPNFLGTQERLGVVGHRS